MTERPRSTVQRLAGRVTGSTGRGAPGRAKKTTARSDANGAAGADELAREEVRAVYVISVAAELAGVHPQTLRIYERKGLVGPSRTGGGSRRYSPADIERLRRIGDLTAAGLNLEGVRRVLELEADLEHLRVELERVRSEAREAIERTHRQYRRDLVPLRQATVVWRNAQASSRARARRLGR